ncbi:agamous-like MADS-box protein AGL30 isoform X3 [Arachis stenosperma]|uniref:agamous-like MADS-box protein AGL30 isoform X3 n=1 Tax=Arachis stenosperma TaxID=217475 RepID=UPI0025AD2C35|nr:agamous-like MADS-box protein AGL30 isoform X3 [Arachis stenosperma]
MGRVKLKIKKLENMNGRQATYAKRKNGIIKKATELSILCDIDIILLMFSPTGKPSLCRGRRRKLESLEALKKTFKKLDHDVNIQEFLGTSSQTIEVHNQTMSITMFNIYLFLSLFYLSILTHFLQDLSNQARLLQTQISETQKRLSQWKEFEKINNVEQLEQMENSLRDSINQIRNRKEHIKNQQLVSLQCNNQFNEMHIPFRMGTEQHLQPLPWIGNGDSPNLVLPDDSSLLLHKDVEGSASSSFGSYASYIGSSSKTDISNSGQENGVLSDLSSTTAPLRLPLNNGHQFPYMPSYNFNLLNDFKFQAAPEMNHHHNQPQENHNLSFHHHVNNGNFEAPRNAYDSNHHHHHGWASTSGPCAVTMFDEHLYAQASLPQVNFGST